MGGCEYKSVYFISCTSYSPHVNSISVDMLEYPSFMAVESQLVRELDNDNLESGWFRYKTTVVLFKLSLTLKNVYTVLYMACIR